MRVAQIGPFGDEGGHGALGQLLEPAVDRRQHERVGLVSFPTHLDDRRDGADVEDARRGPE